MREHLILFATTFALTLVAILIMMPIAHKIGLVDRPKGRKQHVGIIPLIGGISIFLGVATSLSIFGLPYDHHWLYLGCAGTIVILGVFDDYYDLSVKLRLCVQLMVGSAMVYGLNLYLSNLGDLFAFGDIHLSYIGIPFTVIAVIFAVFVITLVFAVFSRPGGVS